MNDIDAEVSVFTKKYTYSCKICPILENSKANLYNLFDNV